jgi:hypothetical protein
MVPWHDDHPCAVSAEKTIRYYPQELRGNCILRLYLSHVIWVTEPSALDDIAANDYSAWKRD